MTGPWARSNGVSRSRCIAATPLSAARPRRIQSSLDEHVDRPVRLNNLYRVTIARLEERPQTLVRATIV